MRLIHSIRPVRPVRRIILFLMFVLYFLAGSAYILNAFSWCRLVLGFISREAVLFPYYGYPMFGDNPRVFLPPFVRQLATFSKRTP